MKKKADKKTRANFGDVLPRPMVEPLALDLGYQSKDPHNLCLFGLAGGAGTLQMFGQDLQAMIHPLFPGMADPDEEIIWGTLEAEPSGPMGSEVGKLVQGYSPIRHLIKAQGEFTLCPLTTMKSLRSLGW